MKNLQELRIIAYFNHDDICNQKYGDNLPYSTHLKFVEAQGEKFIHLISNEYVKNEDNKFSSATTLKDVVKTALTFHDIIEDGRLSYNDVKSLASELGNTVAGEMVADIVYCVTDCKGKSRAERKNDKYYQELRENKLAVFDKLADLSANTLYSKLTNSSMYEKYKSEFKGFKEKVYIAEYDEFFRYLENI